jgi:hypothetical protein
MGFHSKSAMETSNPDPAKVWFDVTKEQGLYRRACLSSEDREPAVEADMDRLIIVSSCRPVP